jgi:hypothetical protein
MLLSAKAKEQFETKGAIFALWAGLLAAPVAWAAQQLTLYTMVPWACQTGHFFAMHLVSAAAILVAAFGALVAQRSRQRAGREPADDDRAGALPRSRFLSVAGLVASGFFALVIFAQWLAVVVIHPCMF